ncbi:MAG: EamA family transporter, partial [Elioraea sp.]|nr:EamA family transporter [Elioraea sp.]
FQAWRTALQQALRGTLSPDGATFVRFLYGAPVAAVLLVCWSVVAGRLPSPMHPTFVGFAAAGGVAQILATSALMRAFAARGYAVGTAYAKTEAVQGALLAWLLLGETVSALAANGVAISLLGVLLLSSAGGTGSLPSLVRQAGQPAALWGLAAGGGFAVAAVLFKAATLSLGGPDRILDALTTLAFATLLQSGLMAIWLARAEPFQLHLSLAAWRRAALVGVLSAIGSACWFSAFALGPVALVRALGQVEMLFTLGFGRLLLRERTVAGEIAGFALVVAGVVLVILGR